MRVKGKIQSWNDDKGFGFLQPMLGGEKVFIHISAFPDSGHRPKLHEVVTYSLSRDKQGRPRAIDASRSQDRSGKKIRSRSSSKKHLNTVRSWFVVLFLSLLVVLTLLSVLPVAALAVYFGASVVAFLAYAIDKSSAKSNRWRIQESTLQIYSLLGGWPGALIAQQLFRHKTRKKSFQSLFWLLACLNFAGLALYLYYTTS